MHRLQMGRERSHLRHFFRHVPQAGSGRNHVSNLHVHNGDSLDRSWVGSITKCGENMFGDKIRGIMASVGVLKPHTLCAVLDIRVTNLCGWPLSLLPF